MKRLVYAIVLALYLVPAVSQAQLSEMRQTVFGMD